MGWCSAATAISIARHKRAARTALAFSADGNTLVLAGAESLHTWRAPSWAEIEAAEKKTEGKTQ
jgi:hypothetical protein